MATMTVELTDNETIRQFFGDDGSCFSVCRDCGGIGKMLGDWEKKCPDCNGTGKVENRERIAEAVDKWQAATGSDERWDNREGKPWQESLEARVSKYREPAPDYLTAMNPDDSTELLLRRLLREAGWGLRIVRWPDSGHFEVELWSHGVLSRRKTDGTNTENSALVAAVLGAAVLAAADAEQDVEEQ